MKKKRRAALLLLAAACGTGALYQGTSAYMTDEAQVVNELDFTGKEGLDAVLKEPSWKPEQGLLMVPNTAVSKDPQVTNTSKLDMDELVALKMEFVYSRDGAQGQKAGEPLSRKDMALAARVFSLDYNCDDPGKGDWVRFEGQKSTDASQCFYYKKTLKRRLPQKGETTAPLFTTVKVRREANNRQADHIRSLGGVSIKISGHVIQQMEGEKHFGLNSAQEAYEAGLFDGLREKT